MDKLDFHWLVGILEGEGSFFIGSNYPRIYLKMTDLDIVERAAKYFQTSITTFYSTNPRHKPTHAITISGYRALLWMQKLYPFMGIRRKKQIEKCFRKYEMDLKEKDIYHKYYSVARYNPIERRSMALIYQYTNASMRKIARLYKCQLRVVQRAIEE